MAAMAVQTCQNKTKVGLKEQIANCQRQRLLYGQNKTKVGLKGSTRSKSCPTYKLSE